MSIRSAYGTLAALTLLAAASLSPGIAANRYPVSVSLQATRTTSVADDHCSIKLTAHVLDNYGSPLSGCSFSWQTDPSYLTVNSPNYSATDVVNGWASTATPWSYSVTVTAAKMGHSAQSNSVTLDFKDPGLVYGSFTVATLPASYSQGSAFTGFFWVADPYACFEADSQIRLPGWSNTHTVSGVKPIDLVGDWWPVSYPDYCWLETARVAGFPRATYPNPTLPVPTILHHVVMSVQNSLPEVPPGYGITPKVHLQAETSRGVVTAEEQIGTDCRLFTRKDSPTTGPIIFDVNDPYRPADHWVDTSGHSAAEATYALPYQVWAPSGIAASVDLYTYMKSGVEIVQNPYTTPANLNMSFVPTPDFDIHHAHVTDDNPYDAPFQITTASLPNGMYGVPYSVTLSTVGGTSPVTFNTQIGEDLPAGLTLSGDTISGTPTVSGSFSTIIEANDGSTPSQYTSKTFPIFIDGFRITTPTSLPDGMLGVPYSATLASANGTSPVTWNIQSGQGLPPGLTLTGNTISGTPTTGGTFGTIVEAHDGSTPSQYASKTHTIYISEP